MASVFKSKGEQKWMINYTDETASAARKRVTPTGGRPNGYAMGAGGARRQDSQWRHRPRKEAYRGHEGTSACSITWRTSSGLSWLRARLQSTSIMCMPADPPHARLGQG